MEDVAVMKKLESIDRELHSLMEGLKIGRHKTPSLSELNRLMESDRVSDEDSTKLIRKMRSRKYGL